MAKTPAPRTGIIDIHHHIIPPALARFIRPIPWTPQGAIEAMDRTGIAVAIASGGIDLGPDPSQHVALARNVNDYGATLVRDYPGRYGQFAALPLPDVAASLIEIDYALDQLHADGFGIATSYGDKWLGDQTFWPVWEKLNARSAVVFVHPQDASCCTPNLMSYTHSPIKGPPIMGAYIEFPMNTARTIFSLMTSGTLRRFPRVNFIFAHGGGVMPLLVQRLAGYVGSPTDASRQVYFSNGVAAEFATLHFECAQAFARPNMDALRDLVPDSKIMFGSDYPSMPLDYVVKQFNDLNLPNAAHAAIARTSAARLLPRWA